MAAPNEKEIPALKMFRHRISDLFADMDDYQKHDQSLLRFLRARDLNLDRAEDMLRKHLQWRKDEDIDNVRSVKLPDFIEDSFRFKVSGFDREGALVAVVPLGYWDLKKAAEGGHRQDFYLFIVQMFEQAMAFLKCRSTKEECHTKVNLLIDFKDFSFKQIASRAVIEMIVDVLNMFEQNYPEVLKTCWVVNAPSFFQIIYKLIKGLLSAHTMSKIKIFSSNADEWRAALLAAIDVDQLPSSHGGSINTVIDYKMEYGFDVFPKYETLPEDELKSVAVLPGQKFSVDLHDIDVGTQIMWNFKTEGYNIGFSLCMGENEVLVPSCKTDAHLHTQKGMWYCEKAGKYTLVFDNSFSKWRGKNLKYGVAIKNPNKFIM